VLHKEGTQEHKQTWDENRSATGASGTFRVSVGNQSAIARGRGGGRACTSSGNGKSGKVGLIPAATVLVVAFKASAVFASRASASDSQRCRERVETRVYTSITSILLNRACGVPSAHGLLDAGCARVELARGGAGGSRRLPSHGGSRGHTLAKTRGAKHVHSQPITASVRLAGQTTGISARWAGGS